MSKINRIVRNDTFKENIRNLEKYLYGFDTPIWKFVSENDIFSEVRTEQFINEILNHLNEDQFLHSYLYVLIRAMTTEYIPYYVLSTEEERALEMKSDAVCIPGKVRVLNINDLVNNLRMSSFELPAYEIYKALCNKPANDIVAYIESLDEFEEDSEDKKYREDYDTAYIEEHPEMINDDIFIVDPQSETYKSAEKEATPDEEEDIREEQVAYQKSVAQDKEIRNAFIEKEKFIDCVEIYFRYRISHQDNKGVYYTHNDEFSFLYNRIKNYMIGTSYTLFENREALIQVNANIIKAQLIAKKVKETDI